MFGIDPVAILTILFTAGAAWGGSIVALNGTRKNVQQLMEFRTETVDRLARIETKIDNHLT